MGQNWLSHFPVLETLDLHSRRESSQNVEEVSLTQEPYLSPAINLSLSGSFPSVFLKTLQFRNLLQLTTRSMKGSPSQSLQTCSVLPMANSVETVFLACLDVADEYRNKAGRTAKLVSPAIITQYQEYISRFRNLKKLYICLCMNMSIEEFESGEGCVKVPRFMEVSRSIGPPLNSREQI